MRPIALPTFEPLGSVVACAVAIVVHHVEDVALRPLLWHRVLVMRTVDIQVVVNAHVNVVVPTVEPGDGTQKKKKGGRLTFSLQQSRVSRPESLNFGRLHG